MGWHEDNEELHGSIDSPYAILSLSLGATRTFLIQRSVGVGGRSTIIDVPMRPGDLLSMNGLFQREFKHKYVMNHLFLTPQVIYYLQSP